MRGFRPLAYGAVIAACAFMPSSHSATPANRDGIIRKLAEGVAPSDAEIYEGYRRYHSVCSHCHGPDGVGSTFAPSLVDRPVAYDVFKTIVLNGRATGNFAMQGFANDPNVAPYVDAIYVYIKARSEGALDRGRPPKP